MSGSGEKRFPVVVARFSAKISVGKFGATVWAGRVTGGGGFGERIAGGGDSRAQGARARTFAEPLHDAHDMRMRNEFSDGPQSLERSERLRVVDQIVARLQKVWGDVLVAIGLFGSTGQDMDLPYSDIEMFCVVDRAGERKSFEWIYGPGKAAVELYGRDSILAAAKEVDWVWPVTHAEFALARPLVGADFIDELRATAVGQPDEKFHEAIRRAVVAEIYEGIGKVRNAMLSRDFSGLAIRAARMSMVSALIVGLARRHIYRSAGALYSESMTLARRPPEHDRLCAMVLNGELAVPVEIAELLERHWTGIPEWLAGEGIGIEPGLRWPF
jgi:kanamycin nucleotidyltransferase